MYCFNDREHYLLVLGGMEVIPKPEKRNRHQKQNCFIGHNTNSFGIKVVMLSKNNIIKQSKQHKSKKRSTYLSFTCLQ